MRLQDISKRVSRKQKTAIQQLGECYEYQVLHRCNFMQMSSTTQINCSYLDIRIKFLIVLSLFHLISIKQIKITGYQWGTSGYFYQPTPQRGSIIFYDMAGYSYYFSNRFYENHPMVPKLFLDPSSHVTDMGHRDEPEQAAKQPSQLCRDKEYKQFQLLKFYCEDKTKRKCLESDRKTLKFLWLADLSVF